jgi:hypothetical protein
MTTEKLRLIIEGDSRGGVDALKKLEHGVKGVDTTTGQTEKAMNGSTSRMLRGWTNLKTGVGQFKDGLGKIVKGDFKGGISGIGDAIHSVGGKGFLAAAGIAAAGAAIFALWEIGKKALTTLMKVGSELAGLGRLTGLEGEGLTGLYGQFRMTGTDPAAAGSAIGRFSKNLKDARGGGKSLDLFKELGVDVKDATGKIIDGNVVLAKTRTALSKIEDTYTRNADAQLLFGKGFKSLGKWLTASEKDIARYDKLVSESGFSWGPKEKKDYATFVRKQREMSLRWDLMWASIGQKMLPLLNKILTKYISPMFNRFSKFLRLLDLIPGKSGAVSQAFQMMFGPILDALDAMNKIIDALDAIKNRSPEARQMTLGALESLYNTLPGFKPIMAIPGVKSLIPGMAGGGYIPRSPGGTLLRVGEGRHDEVVAQVLPGKGKGAGVTELHVHNHFHGPVVGGKAGLRELTDIMNRSLGPQVDRLQRGRFASA